MKFAFAFKGNPFPKYLGAISLPIVVSTILFLVYNQFISPVSLPLTDAVSFTLMLGGMLGAFGEELGWRGYLQSGLNRRLNGFFAFLLVGILWGLWHVGNYQNGPAYMLFFVFSTIGYSAGDGLVAQRHPLQCGSGKSVSFCCECRILHAYKRTH